MGRTLAHAWKLLGCAATLCPSLAAAEDITVVLGPHTESAAFRYLNTQLRGRASVRRLETLPDTRLLVRNARAGAWGDYVAVMDQARTRVDVIRVADGTVLSRSLRGDVSPYALAVAAAELLEVAVRTPAPLAPVPAAPPSLSLAPFAGASMLSVPRRRILLLQPAVALDLWLQRARRSVRWGIGAHAAFPPSTTVHSVDTRHLSVRHSDLALRLLLGGGSRRLGAYAGLLTGVSFVKARLTYANDLLGARRDVLWWFGALAGLRLQLWRGLGATLEVDSTWTPEYMEYLVNGARVFREGHLQLRGRVGLSWELS